MAVLVQLDLSRLSLTLSTHNLPPSVHQPDETPKKAIQSWPIASATILAVGAILRFYDLDLVPFHGDEGNNGYFLLPLVREGFYQYDPQNYHGPTLYYFTAILQWPLRILLGESFSENYGLTSYNLRFVTAAFGLASIGLVLTLRRRIGTVGALAGAVLLAISPGAVYFSRYFIHETLFVFFTLALVVAAEKFYQSAKPFYLMLASTAAALLFATKETAVISGGVLLIALASTTVFVILRRRSRQSRVTQPTDSEFDGGAATTASTARFGGLRSIIIMSLASLAIFLVIELLLYSSFFTNFPNGPYAALKTLFFWARTSRQVQLHPWYTYLNWIFKEEFPLFLLGLTGLGLAIWKFTNRFAIFAGLWAFGLLTAYSLIPYKTPWLLLNFLVPLVLIGGYACEQVYQSWQPRKRRLIATTIAAAIIGVTTYQMLKLNFVHYDNSAYAYVYFHTQREIFPMLDEIDRLAAYAGTAKQTGIEIIAPEYWPLPWYLRKYSNVTYQNGNPLSQPIVIASRRQAGEVLSTSADRYQMANVTSGSNGAYTLRPGIELMLFVRRDLASRSAVDRQVR